MEKSPESYEQVLHNNWERVGEFMLSAMHDIALELGGEKLADRVVEAARSDGILPNPDALKVLEDLHPGSAERVLVMATRIQAETHYIEILNLRKSKIRMFGRALIEGFKGLGDIVAQRGKNF